MSRWYEKAKLTGANMSMEKYFFEIIPGMTEAKSSKIFDSGRGDFDYTIEMPPGSYEVHGISGEFKTADNRSDFDNFIIRVTGHNAVAQAEKLYVPIVTKFEIEDPVQRRFIEQVARTAEGQDSDGSIRGKKIDIMFAIDNSVSMESAATLVRTTVADIVGALKRGGAGVIRVGVITFNNPDSIITLMPLSEMNGNFGNLYNIVENIEFEGGTEPVGKAALKGVSELKGSGDTLCQVMVLTDDDGLTDDRGVIYSEEMVKAATDARVAVNLQRIYTTGCQCGTVAPIEEIVPGEYFVLLDMPLGPNDEARIKRVRELAFGEGVKNNIFRIEAQRALISVGNKDDIDRISSVLSVIDSLSIIQRLIARGEIAADALYKVVEGSASSVNVSEAAKGLITIEGSSALKRLGEMLKDKKSDLHNRVGTANVLAENGDETAFQFLVDTVKTSPASIDSNTMKFLLSRDAISKEVVFNIALDNAAEVSLRRDAVNALAVFDKEKAIEGMEAIFLSNPDSLEVIHNLLPIDRKRGIAVLNQILQTDGYSVETQFAVAKLLAKEGDDLAINYISIKAGSRSDPSELLDLLVSVGEKGLDAVRKIAMSADSYNGRLTAAEVLMKHDKEAARKAVQAILDNAKEQRGFYSLRFRTLSLLLVLDKDGALKILRAHLLHKDGGYRLEVARLILPYDQETASAVLKKLAEDPRFANEARSILDTLPK